MTIVSFDGSFTVKIILIGYFGLVYFQFYMC